MRTKQSTGQGGRTNPKPRIFEYDYDLLPLTEGQRELLDELKAIAPIAMWRLSEKYPSYIEKIIRLRARNLLAVAYDGPRGGKRIHLAKLAVRPGEIRTVPDDELVAWRKGDMWYIKAKWIAVRRGRKRIRLALPRKVLRAAELPRVLYIAAMYKKLVANYKIRYIAATPSAEVAETIRAQRALARLGRI